MEFKLHHKAHTEMNISFSKAWDFPMVTEYTIMYPTDRTVKKSTSSLQRKQDTLCTTYSLQLLVCRAQHCSVSTWPDRGKAMYGIRKQTETKVFRVGKPAGILSPCLETLKFGFSKFCLFVCLFFSSDIMINHQKMCTFVENRIMWWGSSNTAIQN